MQVAIGKEGLAKSYQADFPESTECAYCKGEARIGFVAYEGLDGPLPLPRIPGEEFCRDHNGQVLVCTLHPNEGEGGYWLHDCCSVAVYFCRKCLRTTALYYQG